MKTATAYGECILLRRWPDFYTREDELIIERADPRILIAAELLWDISEGRYHPRAQLTFADDPPPGSWPAAFRRNPLGAILRIEGVNRTVIYRIAEYEILRDCFVAEWPD